MRIIGQGPAGGGKKAKKPANKDNVFFNQIDVNLTDPVLLNAILI